MPQKVIRTIVPALSAGLYVYFVPPSAWYTVAGFICLAALCIYIIVGAWTRRRFAVLAAIGAALFLAMNAVIGFEILNTILLASFIIGTAIVIK